MPRPARWLLDFDDTLASGPITWALGHALPRLIQENHLPHDAARLERAILTAQERGSQQPDPMPVLHDLFAEMQWPHALQTRLLHDVQASYRPELFDDALPFLERLRAHGQTVYIVSNNNRAPELVGALGLSAYISQVFTPRGCSGSLPKPHRSLWDCILAHQTDGNDQSGRIVGDDPWSDGTFAENCGLPCWIVDRLNRYTPLHGAKPYSWVRSLLEIPLP